MMLHSINTSSRTCKSQKSTISGGATKKMSVLFLMIFTVILGLFINIYVLEDDTRVFRTINYVLHNSICRKPDPDPFNPEVRDFYKRMPYVHCNNKLNLLTFIKKNKNHTVAVLYVNDTLLAEYSDIGVRCYIGEVKRLHHDDFHVQESPMKEFKNNVSIKSPIVVVECQDTSFNNYTVYKNVHYTYFRTPKIIKKLKKVNKTTRPLSVLIIGLDSISQLNMKRTMPQTRQFLFENDWVELNGYNKIGDNTLPNVMGFLTGKNKSLVFKHCNPNSKHGMDNCDRFIFYEFRKMGYVTTHAEDSPSMNTFNMYKVGFTSEPVDYYLRPYMLATYSLESSYLPVSLDGIEYCAGPESYPLRIMNAVKDFTITFKNGPSFGFFWMSFAHNDLNAPTRMDAEFRKFFESLKETGALENTAVFFLSDHGLRFGNITSTITGWLEERSPFFFVRMPPWFQQRFPLQYKNLKDNKNKLTSPYDFYMTLQDILERSSSNYIVKPSQACSQCNSLFKNIDYYRSCEQAGIPVHWCTCQTFSNRDLDVTHKMVQDAGKLMVNMINLKISSFIKGGLCNKYTVDNIKSAWPTQYSEHIYVILIIQVSPFALFEGTIRINKDSTYSMDNKDEFSRLDEYGQNENSGCVNDHEAKLYCNCNKTVRNKRRRKFL